MKLQRTLNVILLVIISFAAYYFLFLQFETIKVRLDKITNQGLISYILTYILIGIPLFFGTYYINKHHTIFESLGLCSSIKTAFGLSLIFTLPMFIGGALFFNLNLGLKLENVIAGTIVAGFVEELYFRGFLFGQLFRNTKLGFIPSVLFGAILFAFGHLYQSQVFSELVGIFMITFFGAVLFAWLYVEWNYNLWVSIGTHFLMNLSWVLFDIDSSALGDIKANIFRGLTILTIILFTIIYKKRKGQKMAIQKSSLFLKRN